ncbi:unnamed protein product, partial [Musa textilis]
IFLHIRPHLRPIEGPLHESQCSVNPRMSCPKGIVTLLQKLTPQIIHPRNINSIPFCVDESLLDPKSSCLAFLNQLHQGYCLGITVQS